MPYLKYIKNEHHYTQVVERIIQAQQSLWIGTADIKDLYVKEGINTVPLLKVFSDLIKKGVIIRLIHAKEPGRIFRDDFDKYPILWSKLERKICPRVHFKIIIIDDAIVYLGSANLTGSGLGMKGITKRNFESGILSNMPELLNSTKNHFEEVWNRKHCNDCGRKEFCGDWKIP